MALQNTNFIAENVVYPQFVFLDATFEDFNNRPVTETTGEEIFNRFISSLQESNQLKIYNISSKISYYKSKNITACKDQKESLLLYWLFLNRYLLVYNRDHPKLQTRKAFYTYARKYIHKTLHLDFSEVKTVSLHSHINHTTVDIPPFYKIDKEFTSMVLGLDDIKL